MKIRLGLLCGLLLSVFSVKGQNWGGGIDDNDLHFGFTFQYVSSEYKVLKNANWRTPFKDEAGNDISGPLKAIYSKSSPGFGIGFVVNYRLAEHSDLRFTPSLVFSDRLLYYDFLSNEDVIMPFTLKEQKVQATMVEFPLGYKLKSDRRNNFRAYVLGGAKYSRDISSNKKTDDTGNTPLEKLLKNKKNIFSYEAGIGFDLYFEYFKMSPEIKLSYSLNSVLKDEPQPYVLPLNKLMLRHVTFSLFFE
jgi:hypothetical protein